MVLHLVMVCSVCTRQLRLAAPCVRGSFDAPLLSLLLFRLIWFVRGSLDMPLMCLSPGRCRHDLIQIV